jgi:hypothetical protein
MEIKRDMEQMEMDLQLAVFLAWIANPITIE